MLHEMRLHDEPFEKINAGVKTVEFRLFDDKRRHVKLGDFIIFSKRTNEADKIEVRVTAIKTFPSFNAMAKSYPGAKGTEKYYSPDEEKECGVVAIEFKKTKENHRKV